MPIQIINGFPQFFELGYLSGTINGSASAEWSEYQDIDMSKDLDGDTITCLENETHLLEVNRSGAILASGKGFTLVQDNIIRVYPNLTANEFVEVKKLQAVADIGNIPVTYILPEPLILKINEASAVCWTNNSKPNIKCDDAYVLNGNTIIRTTFSFDPNNVSLFLNGNKISKDIGVWNLIDSNQIQLSGDYSAKETCVEIVSKQVVQ